MKLKREGFTLIELLAVIVVLGIILVIAIPRVVDTIEDSRKGAFEASVKSYVKAAQQYVAKEEVNGTPVIDGEEKNIDVLDMPNKSNWNGKWTSNNGIITFNYIEDTNSGYRARNVTNNITGSISCGSKCIAYNSPDINYYALPTTAADLTAIGLRISGTTLSGPYTGAETDIIVPDGVTTIGNQAFSLNLNPTNKIKTVVIPTSITTIGENAFFNNELTSVIIPGGVTTIGGGAFSNNQLTSVVIPSSVQTIGSSAFSFNELTSVTIPSTVTTIGGSAFVRNQLTSITLPSGLTTISDSAFMNNQLTSVTIPNTVTTIERGAFASNENLTTIINKSSAKNWASILGNVFINDVFTCTPNPGKGDASSFISGTCTNGTRTVTITE